MSQAAAVAQRPASHWIVSPAWDLVFIIASPLAIVPLIWLATRDLLSPEALVLPVLAFATLGHHLPGYMRAYGDRELFQQFRLRFLLVPPVLFVTVLAFAWPQIYGVKHLPFHGLELIALLWSTWHGLMQIYGFMRMYDRKRGIEAGWTPRLDLALCITIFAAGTIFSDSRVYALMDALWKAGVPTFGPEWLVLARELTTAWVALVVIAYVTNFLRSDQRDALGAWAKLALAASTGFIYWFAGRLSTNILIGVAIFEIFHGVQYFAIVWIFNRRKVERVGRNFGWLGFLFEDSWGRLALYLLAIAGFGSLYFVLGDVSRYTAALDHPLGGRLETVLLSLFVTSNLLHYYYDGFIWKFRSRKASDARPKPRFDLAPLAHLGKWSIFYLAAIGLLALELSRPVTPETLRERYGVLASWTPDLPEIQGRLIRADLERGDAAGALERAQHASALRPRSSAAQADLGVTLLANGRFAEAETALRHAIELEPRSTRLRLELGNSYLQAGSVLDELGKPEAAARSYREFALMAPDPATGFRKLAQLLLETRPSPAERARAEWAYRQALAQDPSHARTHYNLGSLLYEQGRISEGRMSLLEARSLGYESPALNRMLTR